MNKMKLPIIPAIVLIAAFMFSLCSNETNNSPIEGAAGNYIGTLAKPQQGVMNPNHEIKVEVVDSETIRITSVSGGSKDLELKTEKISENNYNLRLPIDNNFIGGTLSTGVGRIAYSYFLGGQDDSNIEVFSGEKK